MLSDHFYPLRVAVSSDDGRAAFFVKRRKPHTNLPVEIDSDVTLAMSAQLKNPFAKTFNKYMRGTDENDGNDDDEAQSTDVLAEVLSDTLQKDEPDLASAYLSLWDAAGADCKTSTATVADLRLTRKYYESSVAKHTTPVMDSTLLAHLLESFEQKLASSTDPSTFVAAAAYFRDDP